MDVLKEYWWVGGIALLPILLLWIRHMAKTKAKIAALKWLAVAERFVFQVSDQQITFVSQKAYGMLSPSIKLFVPYALFNVIVMELYHEVKGLIVETHKKINAS